MTAYSLAVQADVRKRMSPPNRQDVPQISKELGIHRSTLYQWRSNWRLQGEVVPASEKDPDRWSAADKFTVVLETAGFNATELSSYWPTTPVRLGALITITKAYCQVASLWPKPGLELGNFLSPHQCKRDLALHLPIPSTLNQNIVPPTGS